jgi:pyruvate/2-oxoacid:ferredoxin oxidoreductase beta subunit
VSEYLKLQGRFHHLTQDEVDAFQRSVDRDWDRLVKLEQVFGATRKT